MVSIPSYGKSEILHEVRTFGHRPENLLVNSGKIAVIIDWEMAGWYPEYWEYTRWAVSNYRSSQRWQELREEVLECYLEELWVEEYLDSVFTRL